MVRIQALFARVFRTTTLDEHTNRDTRTHQPLLDPSNMSDIQGEVPKNDDYVSRTGQKQANVPVMSDDQVGNVENNPSREQADSDAQLGSFPGLFLPVNLNVVR